MAAWAIGARIRMLAGPTSADTATSLRSILVTVILWERAGA